VSDFIDVNTYLSRWPFRRVHGDETPALVERLRRHGVTQAWAGSFDSLLHRDIAGVNLRVAEECRRHGDGLLTPIGAVNPKLPDWEDDVRRCREVHGMPGIRLHPNYHGYPLDDPDFLKLLDAAEKQKLIVQIALSMEDERTQHPLVQVPHVDVTPLAEQAKSRPALRIVLVNAFRAMRPEKLDRLIEAGNVSFDIAMLEGIGGVGKLLTTVPHDRILFGSYAPYFHFEAALLKLQESELGGEQRSAIVGENANRLVADR
jgi:predicted TIM-barrel fold metal-dependent hydrolase